MNDPDPASSILQLPPGRDLDVRAARAMGYTVSMTEAACPVIDDGSDLPRYTEDSRPGYAAMRECVEWLTARGWGFAFHRIGAGIKLRPLPPMGHKGYAMIETKSIPHAVALLVLLVDESERREKGK